MLNLRPAPVGFSVSEEKSPHAALIKAIIFTKLHKVLSSYNLPAGRYAGKLLSNLLAVGSFLSRTILHVFLLRPPKQMGGPEAARIIALVADIKIDVKGAIVNLVGYSVRHDAYNNTNYRRRQFQL